MIAQWRLGAMDRMRLIDRPEEVFSPDLLISMRQLDAIQSILAKALLKARESNQRVRSLRVVVGEIAEIDTASIRKYWDELSKGTPAERVPLHFRFIKAEVQCMACFQKYHPPDGKIHCPYCGSYGAKVLSGEELFLESIEFDDEQT
jgi:hydrogenase nickel incorporation protein HypA/HybF